MKGFASCLVLFFLALTDATAQTVPASFEQLQVLVGPGDRIYVTNFAGNVSKGRVTELSNSSLKLLVDGTTRDLSPSDVFEIKQRRNDSLGNGAIIGGVTGLGIGAIAMAAFCTSFNCNPGEIMLTVMIHTGIGAGIGVGIDALVPAKQTVFQNRSRNSSLRIRWQPLLGRSRKGVLVSVSF